MTIAYASGSCILASNDVIVESRDGGSTWETVGVYDDAFSERYQAVVARLRGAAEMVRGTITVGPVPTNARVKLDTGTDATKPAPGDVKRGRSERSIRQGPGRGECGRITEEGVELSIVPLTGGFNCGVAMRVMRAFLTHDFDDDRASPTDPATLKDGADEFVCVGVQDNRPAYCTHGEDTVEARVVNG